MNAVCCGAPALHAEARPPPASPRRGGVQRREHRAHQLGAGPLGHRAGHALHDRLTLVGHPQRHLGRRRHQRGVDPEVRGVGLDRRRHRAGAAVLREEGVARSDAARGASRASRRGRARRRGPESRGAPARPSRRTRPRPARSRAWPRRRADRPRRPRPSARRAPRRWSPRGRPRRCAPGMPGPCRWGCSAGPRGAGRACPRSSRCPRARRPPRRARSRTPDPTP